MKKILVGLLFSIFLCSTSAVAVPFYFNPTGVGGFGSAIEMDVIYAVSGAYNVNLDLGTGGELDAGDTFTETLNSIINGYLPTSTGAFNSFSPTLSAFTSDATGASTTMSGIVASYIDGDGTAITATNASAALLSNDNFSIGFGLGSGYLTFEDGVSNRIGTFAIVSGGGDFIANNNATPTSDVGLTMVATDLNFGYFFNAAGVDYKTLMGQNNFIISLADSSVNVTSVTGASTNSLQLGLTDNGTSIQFSTVPEPATFILLGLALLCMAATGRKRIN